MQTSLNRLLMFVAGPSLRYLFQARGMDVQSVLPHCLPEYQIHYNFYKTTKNFYHRAAYVLILEGNVKRSLGHKTITLRWRHNERNGVSNPQRLDGLLKLSVRRKHQSSAPLVSVRGIRWPVDSPHKGSVTRKMSPFHGDIMNKFLGWGTPTGASSHPKINCYRWIEALPMKDSARLRYTWWRHLMQTFSALLALCVGNSPVTGEFPSQRPVTRSFDVFFICAWTNNWAHNVDAGDLRRQCPHNDVTVMIPFWIFGSGHETVAVLLPGFAINW